MMKHGDEIEQFPVQKRQIRFDAEPEMLFFDVDEDPEEADFIRVDDLFRLEAQPNSQAEMPANSADANTTRKDQLFQRKPQAEIPEDKLPVKTTRMVESIPLPGMQSENSIRSFTLFPRKKDLFIDSHLSRVLRRTLLLTACRLEKPVDKIRIRPQFIQWQMELPQDDDPEIIIREFRDALELQAQNLRTTDAKDNILSDTCLVQPAEKERSAEETARAVIRYQEGEKKKERRRNEK